MLFQRFFARQSFARFDRWLVADACVFMACKVEECHRKIRDVMAASHRSRHANARLPFEAGTPPFIARRDAVTDAERRVLYTLEFDVAVEAPYPAITAAVKRWRDAGCFGKREEKSAEAFALDRAAGEVAFAMMTTEMCLAWTPQEVAVGALWLALRHAQQAAAAGGGGAGGSSGAGGPRAGTVEDPLVFSLGNHATIRGVCDDFVSLLAATAQAELALLRAREEWRRQSLGQQQQGQHAPPAADVVGEAGPMGGDRDGADTSHGLSRSSSPSAEATSREAAPSVVSALSSHSREDQPPPPPDAAPYNFVDSSLRGGSRAAQGVPERHGRRLHRRGDGAGGQSSPGTDGRAGDRRARCPAPPLERARHYGHPDARAVA